MNQCVVLQDGRVDVVQEFVEVLLDSASQVTKSSLAQLRAATCQCLVELETCYPVSIGW